VRNAYKISVGKLKGRNYLGDICVDERIIFKYVVKSQRGKVLPGFVLLRIGSSCPPL
jgi:hypothetical protein